MPDYTDLGHSDKMGPQLRHLVEQQLLADLRCYGIERSGTRFDWSDSCVEGHDGYFLDGKLENYSSISVLDENNECIAVGWMDFLLADDFLLVYWDFLSGYSLETYEGPSFKTLKSKPGTPPHVWQQIPLELRPLFASNQM